MGEVYVAASGTYRKVTEQFVAVNGTWRLAPSGLVSVGGTWRTSFSGVPSTTLTAARDTSAPYARISYTYSAVGTWKKLEVVLQSPAGYQAVLKSYGTTGGTTTTVGESGQLITGRTPYETDTIFIRYTDTADKVTNINQVQVTLAAPPSAKNFRAWNVSHNSGGVDWDSSPEVDDWQSQNNTLGTSWNHAGDLPYIHYGSGLGANTTYSVQTRSIVNGVYGPWTASSWRTSPPPYTSGSYDHGRGGADCYQTGESGGQAAKWQNPEGRSTWYHGNGDYWGSTRGVQKTCFFYNEDGNFNVVRNALNNGARVNRAWLYVTRANVDAGNGGAVPVIYALHSTTHPGAPGNVSGNAQGPSLGKGASAWVEVSAHWASLIITQHHPYTGFMIGDSGNKDHYMAIDKNGSVGTIRYEIV